MVAKLKVCKYQSYRRDNNDELHPKIYCKLLKDFCVAQRFCLEKSKYIITEKIEYTCKNFKDNFKE